MTFRGGICRRSALNLLSGPVGADVGSIPRLSMPGCPQAPAR